MTTHIPISISCLALCIFLGAQITSVQQGRKSLDWQAANQEKQLASLSEAETKLADVVKQNESLVKQSEQVQSQYTALLTDVVELAKTDDDAKKVIEKWKIQLQPPAAKPSPSPSPAGL